MIRFRMSEVNTFGVRLRQANQQQIQQEVLQVSEKGVVRSLLTGTLRSLTVIYVSCE